jgi:chemotaxis protein methyltransferase CheR
LRDGGYLLTGHAELHHHDPAPLVPRVFPESVIYQRCDQAASSARKPELRPLSGLFEATSTPKKLILAPQQTIAAPTASRPVLASSVALRGKEVRKAPVEASSPKPPSREREKPEAVSIEEWCQRARARANAGQHEEAIKCCRNAIAQEPVAVEAYLIWAQVAQEQGLREEAKNLFKKVIYLAPSQVEAYLELGAIYDEERDSDRARRMRLAALDVLRGAGSLSNPNGLSHGLEKSEVEATIAHLEALLALGGPQRLSR